MIFNGFAFRSDLDKSNFQENLSRAIALEEKSDINVLKYWNRRWEYPYLMQASMVCNGSMILDAGVGKSLFPFLMAENGFETIALDIDDGSFYKKGSLITWYKKTKEKINKKVKYVVGDISSMNFKNSSFDAVFSMSVLEHLEFPLIGLKELVRILKPGGVLAITVDVSLDHTRQLSKKNLFEMMSYLEIIGSPIFPKRELVHSDLLTTDWFRKVEPGALPWKRYKRSKRDKLKSLIKKDWNSFSKRKGAFFSMGVVGLTYRRTS